MDVHEDRIVFRGEVTSFVGLVYACINRRVKFLPNHVRMYFSYFANLCYVFLLKNVADYDNAGPGSLGPHIRIMYSH